MRAIERQKANPPKQPIPAQKAAGDDQGKGPKDQDDTDVEVKAQGRPWGRQEDDVALPLYVDFLMLPQAGDGAAINIGKGIPAFKTVKAFAAFKHKLPLRYGPHHIMAGKAPHDAFKPHIIQHRGGFIIDERADEEAGEIDRHD